MFYDLLLQLVLLMSAMLEQPLEQFATTEAIQCTEIYEFVQRLASKTSCHICRYVTLAPSLATVHI